MTVIAASVTRTIRNRRWFGTHDERIREWFERLTDVATFSNTARSASDASDGLDPDLDAAALRALEIIRSAA